MSKPIKCVFAGASQVGKTAICKRMKNGSFTENPMTTIGNNFETIDVPYEGQVYKIQLWDTAGQERYQSIATSVFKTAKIILLVFSLDSVDSFNDLNRWIPLIRDTCSADVKIILIGNKSDLPDRKIPQDNIDSFKNSNNIACYLDTSALDGSNIDLIAYYCVSETLKSQEIDASAASPKVTLESKSDKQKRKSGCC